MSTLILDRSDLSLETDAGTVVLRAPGQTPQRVPLKLIERVIIHGRHTLDSKLLTELAGAGVPVLLLSARHSKRQGLLLGRQHNDAAIRLAQAQRVMDPDWCARWAQRQVRTKLRQQRSALHRLQTHRPDQHKALHDGIRQIENLLTRLQGPATADTASLLGHEGAGARSYFAAFTQVFAPALGFTGRNRRPPRDPVNAVLSLGYTLLHVDAVTACQMAGLDPLLGFYHRPAYGRESLASDLIEPYRAHLDLFIWQLFAQRELRIEHFSHDKDACLLGKAGRATFYAAYEAHAGPHRKALRRQARILARHLRTQGEPWLEENSELEP